MSCLGMCRIQHLEKCRWHGDIVAYRWQGSLTYLEKASDSAFESVDDIEMAYAWLGGQRRIPLLKKPQWWGIAKAACQWWWSWLVYLEMDSLAKCGWYGDGVAYLLMWSRKRLQLEKAVGFSTRQVSMVWIWRGIPLMEAIFAYDLPEIPSVYSEGVAPPPSVDPSWTAFSSRSVTPSKWVTIPSRPGLGA